MIDTFLHIWTKILESNLFNFVLMLILLDWIVKKGKIAEKLEAGRKSIEQKITESQKAKENSIKELFELQEKSKEITKQAHEILEKSDANAVIVGEKIVADAKKQANEFGKNLDKIIESNTKSVQNDLTEKTAQTVIKVAQNYIEKELEADRNLHIKFINKSLDALNGVEF